MNSINPAASSPVNTVQQLTQLQTQNSVAAQNAVTTDVDSTANRIQDTRDNINVNRSGGDNALKSTGVNMAKMDISLSQTELIVYDGELSSANIELQGVRAQLLSKKADAMAEEARTVASQNAKFTERYQSAFTNLWDKDKDGTLSTADVTSFGWKAADWNKHVLKHDKSGDGKMDFDELLSVWRQFDTNKDGNLEGTFGMKDGALDATTTTGEMGVYFRGDYSKVSDSIVDKNSPIRLEINTLENKEKDYKAAITRLMPLRAAAESNLVNAHADLINYEAMDDSELTDDPSTRKSMEQNSLVLARRANNLGSFMATSSLVQATDFDELGVSEADMLRGEVSAHRRFRMNTIGYIDKGLERTDTRNDATAKLISGLARLAEASAFEEKSIQCEILAKEVRK
ncbi:MAG: hypothetical protein ACOYK1_09775 [Vampirovibrionia bacterium]|jgi:Ca2+-binding EF-hand superfamily protein